MTPAATASAIAAETPQDNAAWVDIELPQRPAAVLAELRDIGRFLRLNPHLELRVLEEMPALQDATRRYRLEALNETNGLAVSCGLTFRDTGGGGFRLHYERGLKLATEVRAQARATGCLLTIRESYRLPQGDAELAEVDRSLTPWGVAIRRHFLGQARRGGWPLYRWWRERVWLAMVPRERRVTRLIVSATLIEFVVFLAALFVLLD